MKLKTYTAETMAQALAQVRKDLGANAMILHTRSFRTGSWLGIGGKAMVEITASSPQPTSNKPRKTRKAQRASQAPVAIESKSDTDQSLQENHIKDVTDIPDLVERKPAPTKQQTNQQTNTQSDQNAQDTKQRMTEIKDALSEAQRTTEELTKASSPKPTSSSSEQLDDRSILLQGLMGLDRKSPTIDREPQQDPVSTPMTPTPEPIEDIKAPETLISSTESMANDLISSPIFSDEFEPTTFQQLSDIPEQHEPTPQPDPESRTTLIPEPASTQPEPERPDPAQSDTNRTANLAPSLTPVPDPVAAVEPKATPSPEPRLHIGSPFGPSIDDTEEPAIHLRDEINQDRPSSTNTNTAEEQPEQFDLDALRSLDAKPELADLQPLAIDRAESESIEDESINVTIDEPVESPAIAEQSSEPLKPETAGFAEPPKSEAENSALKAEIESLKAMMGQVLDSTRRTAVAVNKTNPDAMLPSAKMSAPLHAMYTEMIDNDVSVELADQFAGAVRDRLDASELENESIVRHAMLTEIESSINTTSDSFLTHPESRSQSDRPHVIALIGPTGVGKTTTVAKLAATAKLRHGMNVALITSDTYRIAAVEQLRTYAAIIGLELKIANTPEEIKDEISSLKDVDLIVIDTAGRSQNNHARLDELGSLIESAQPDETHLVLSSTVGENVLRKTADRFRDLGPDRCILTKIDEAVTTGMIAGISDRIGLPLSFVTIGQEVPDDILPARADRLARAVLDGPQAVVQTQEQQQELAQEST